MKIGFIGAGNVTRTFGRHFTNAGHSIVVSNSRGPETLADFVAEFGSSATAGTKQQAADCDVVILATHWVDVNDALKDVDWRGRILIDATNAHVGPVPDISIAGVTRSRAALRGRTSSEVVAEIAVGARLVKSISNMPMDWIQDFTPNKPRTVIFTSGDDAEAKQQVIELIDSTGLVAIDLGSLSKGGAMHEVGAPLSGLDLHFVRRLRPTFVSEDVLRVQVVKDFFAAIGRRDTQALLALSAEDIEWIIPGEDWPLAGTHRGHAGLEKILQKANETVETSFPTPPEFVAQGDRVLLIGFATGRIKATNKTFEDHFVFAVTVRNGKLTRIREYIDTQALARASEMDASPSPRPIKK